MAAETTIAFRKAADLARVLTPARLRVLQVAREVAREQPREKQLGVVELARRLQRDTRAVCRDVDLLEKMGVLLSTPYEKNPGHGRRRVVKPAAAKIRLVVTV